VQQQVFTLAYKNRCEYNKPIFFWPMEWSISSYPTEYVKCQPKVWMNLGGSPFPFPCVGPLQINRDWGAYDFTLQYLQIITFQCVPIFNSKCQMGDGMASFFLCRKIGNDIPPPPLPPFLCVGRAYKSVFVHYLFIPLFLIILA
jgi:hypothetical protein